MQKKRAREGEKENNREKERNKDSRTTHACMSLSLSLTSACEMLGILGQWQGMNAEWVENGFVLYCRGLHHCLY